MKMLKRLLTIICIGSSFLLSGQIAKKGAPKFVTVTYLHWDFENGKLDIDGWKRVEKEYFDNVTSKNEFLRSSTFYIHRFSDDSSELVLINSYDSWEDINKANDRNKELEEEAWPLEQKRKEVLGNISKYYTAYHADEIYRTLPQIKPVSEYATVNREMFMYLRTWHFSKSGNGPDESFQQYQKLFLENVFNKNEFIKGYYGNVHAWGSDNTEFVEAFYIRSFSDYERMLLRNDELISQAWPDEAERNRIQDEYRAFFSGQHGDKLYVVVPEFSK
ncbi:hypothetical protein [Formosa sp. S-31]|uniref:hypothetical protein n=1 Tax=Formosa sp. S-31 TaxID=2790949 RepID=UPI003EBCDED5